MDRRRKGIAVLARGARVGEQGFGFFVTPQQMEAKATELGAAFDAFNRDVQAFKPPSAKAAEWSRWAQSWRDFRASWESLRSRIANEFWVRASGGTSDLILQFQDRLSQWQRDFQKQWGAKLTAPPVEAIDAVRGTPKKHNRWADIGSGVAVGVATAVVLYGLRKVIA